MTENSDVKKRFQSIPIFGEFRFFRQNDHELESGLGGRQLASHGQTGAPSIRHAARITVHIQHPTARRPGRQHNGYSLFHGIFNAGNHGRRHVAATETFDHDAFAPLSKTYRTCHKPEVGLILLSNRFENLPKSSGHGNGIAAFLARCFFTVSHNTATYRRIPLEFLGNLSTEALPLQSPAECLPTSSYRC